MYDRIVPRKVHLSRDYGQRMVAPVADGGTNNCRRRQQIGKVGISERPSEMPIRWKIAAIIDCAKKFLKGGVRQEVYALHKSDSL